MSAQGYQTFAMKGHISNAAPLGEITNRQNTRIGGSLNPHAAPFVPQYLKHLQQSLPPTVQAVLKEEPSTDSAEGHFDTQVPRRAQDTTNTSDLTEAKQEAAVEAAQSAGDGQREPPAAQPVLPVQSTLGQWLRTCASATDMEDASLASVAPSQTSATEPNRAAPGTLQAGAENSDAAADQVGDAGARTSMLAPIKTADLASAMTQDGGSLRTCMTTLADGVKRLPKWARGLEALQSPQLQALAEQWQQQQAHLSSVHLHPHEEEQAAELRYLQDHSSAFEAQDAPAKQDNSGATKGQDAAAKQEEEQPQEDKESSGKGMILPSSSAGHRGLLAQAPQSEPAAEDADRAEENSNEAPAQAAPEASTVARLVRHWQHHPISLPPVSKLNLDRANSSNPEDASGSGSGSRFVTPVVLSKVQHYLDTSAPSPLECGSSSAPQNAVTAAEQAAVPILGDSGWAEPAAEAASAAAPASTAAPAPTTVAADQVEESVRRRDGLDPLDGIVAATSNTTTGESIRWSSVKQAQRTQWWGKGKGGFFSERRK